MKNKKSLKIERKTSKNHEIQLKPHFCTHKKNGHPAFIYDEFGNEYKYIGITHAPITHDLPNKKLHVNPRKGDDKPSYMRPFSTHEEKKSFKKKKLANYKLARADKKTARKIKKNYRQ